RDLELGSSGETPDMKGVRIRPMLAQSRLPLLVSRNGAGAGDLPQWIREHRPFVDAKLLAHGAILFRGFPVLTVEAFEKFAAAYSADRAQYMYRSTPRTAVAKSVMGQQ